MYSSDHWYRILHELHPAVSFVKTVLPRDLQRGTGKQTIIGSQLIGLGKRPYFGLH